MNDQELKDGVSDFLRGAGFSVKQIRKAKPRTPDLLAIKEQRYVIEIKTKEDDPRATAARHDALRRGQIVTRVAPFVPQNTMSRVIKDGVAQLTAYPATDWDFTLLWLVATGADTEAQCRQFLGTLYGLTNVVGPDDHPLIPCYYFRNSAFFRWHDLDGAIVGTVRQGKLCVNNYSPRVNRLKSSSLARLFGTAVTDPRDLEAIGSAYIADCGIDRRDKQAVIEYLQTKYRRPALMPMDLQTWEAFYLPEEEEA